MGHPFKFPVPPGLFIACMVSGSLKMLHPEDVCVSRELHLVTSDTLNDICQYLWKVSCSHILLLEFNIPIADFVVLVDAFRVRDSPIDVVFFQALMFRTMCFASQLM